MTLVSMWMTINELSRLLKVVRKKMKCTSFLLIELKHWHGPLRYPKSHIHEQTAAPYSFICGCKVKCVEPTILHPSVAGENLQGDVILNLKTKHLWKMCLESIKNSYQLIRSLKHRCDDNKDILSQHGFEIFLLLDSSASTTTNKSQSVLRWLKNINNGNKSMQTVFISLPSVLVCVCVLPLSLICAFGC